MLAGSGVFAFLLVPAPGRLSGQTARPKSDAFVRFHEKEPPVKAAFAAFWVPVTCVPSARFHSHFVDPNPVGSCRLGSVRSALP
jgi:hypothetical protein